MSSSGKGTKTTACVVYFACRGFRVQATEGDDYSDSSFKIPRATLIEDDNVALFRSEDVKIQWFWYLGMRSIVSHTHFVRRCLARFGPGSTVKSNMLRFAGRKGVAHTPLIVSPFSLFARSEAVYDMRFVPLRAVFLHEGSRKGHRRRPTGRSVSGTLMHLSHKRLYGLGMGVLVMGCSQT